MLRSARLSTTAPSVDAMTVVLEVADVDDLQSARTIAAQHTSATSRAARLRRVRRSGLGSKVVVLTDQERGGSDHDACRKPEGHRRDDPGERSGE